MIKKPELLAPAGDLERLKYALHYGADAVYLGGPMLGLRANAINFTFDDIKEGSKFAHSLGKKIYVTVNIVLHNKEIKEAVEKLDSLSEDERMQRIADLREKAILDEKAIYAKGLDDGIKEGLEKGKQKEKLEIAKKLKKEGMNTELIAEITKLKIKEIAEI